MLQIINTSLFWRIVNLTVVHDVLKLSLRVHLLLFKYHLEITNALIVYRLSCYFKLFLIGIFFVLGINMAQFTWRNP